MEASLESRFGSPFTGIGISAAGDLWEGDLAYYLYYYSWNRSYRNSMAAFEGM